ncbi:ligase-associated DNA damage response DEXH box helicase [Phragmitibacter flavus]|uniref:Ligase-associated DNA damage response DEXH box helicase n=1 Tax=Phragmitibacter flavus TaxID=2576071 RepID=A0A5R8KI85_9BACT|nr:ligase-associated DNA damage response DEXH box helicase [Phragmitibacter flavus]TLD71967.1 ligase-associated DNA damage response DEXH box helicase [Phragmitibacter flavus]
MTTKKIKPPKDPWLHWFKTQRWKPFPFQQQTWSAYLNGKSGLVHAPTGLGKTYAVWGGPILDWLQQNPDPTTWPKISSPEPLRVLWITPLRALANDTVESLQLPIRDLRLPWTVELRTGDTKSAARQRQRKHFPTCLVTTPESLSLLLSYPDLREKFATLQAVIIDEWHELLSSKRGVQTELCLARLRRWQPNLRTWGLSATLGNLPQALEVLTGPNLPPEKTTLISAQIPKKFELKTLLPTRTESFPWSGHVGLHLLKNVIAQIEKKQTTLLFTNTRSQSEIWFQALLNARPDWADKIALHHGSIDRSEREKTEIRLRSGDILCVVCTGSLDLGVDFSPVEQVIQIGGPKGIARLLQRAGRSGHQPGATSRIFCVPAHAMELVEFAAIRDAISLGQIESRDPLTAPLDLLAQHLVTLALGGGFTEPETLAEIRSTHAYRHLSDRDWQWTLDFVVRGGNALRAYPQFKRVQKNTDGLHLVTEPHIARFHRMSVGTITSDAMITVKLQNGAYLGSLEESFIARLKPGDPFSFAGHRVELVRVRDMAAIVRRSQKASRLVPQWMGGHMPLSSQLATAVRAKLAEARLGHFHGPEMTSVKPVLELQARDSLIPNPDELLIESAHTREGHHYFIYPFAGRLAHEGLASLTAFRLSRDAPRSITLTMNDYGFCMTTPTPVELDPSGWQNLLSPDHLLDDLLACLNSGELTKRKFREIARIAGLIFQGYPGASKSTRQIQASSGLFFDVFTRYDPDNLLLNQARREVLQYQLDEHRLTQTLRAIQTMKVIPIPTERLTPLSFPLWTMWIQGQVSTEAWSDRVRRMAEQLESTS